MLTRKIIFLCILIFGVVGFYAWFFTSRLNMINEECREKYGREISNTWSGIVIEKKEDVDNHLAKTLILKENNQDIQVLVLSIERSGLYEAAHVGDSIFKLAHDSTVVLKHRDVVSRFELDYKCY